MKNYLLLFVAVIIFMPSGLFTSVKAQTITNSGISNQIELLAGSPMEQQNVGTALHFFDHPQAVVRFAEAAINNILKNPGEVFPGDEISIELFDNVNYTAVVQSVNQNINSTFTVTGKIVGFDFGYLIMTTTGNRSLANISLPETGQYFQIISDPVTLEHYILELNRESMNMMQNSPPLLSGSLTDEELLEQMQIIEKVNDRSNGPEDPANIDLMIVYTPAAQNWANSSGGGIANVIAQAVAKAQLVMSNSQTIITVTLVHSSLVSYTESGNSGTDLQNFTFTNGVMDEVQTWRNTYGADLSVIFTLTDDTGGLGWLLTNRFGSAAYGFSLTRVQQAGWTNTTIHEIGHNMGAHHHKQQLVQPGPTVWGNWSQNTWSAGWRWTGTNNAKFCSVMTYESGIYFPDGVTHTQVPYFSNPLVNYQGVATGHAADGDNARTLKEVKHYVAAYRIGTIIPVINISPQTLVETHVTPVYFTTQTLTVTNSGTGQLNFNISIPAKSVKLTVPEDIQHVMDFTPIADPDADLSEKEQHPTATPFLMENQVVRWDNGTNSSSIGRTGGGTFYVAAYFPSSVMSQHAGFKLRQVEIFISDIYTSLTLNIYGQGTSASPGPLLHTQAVTAEPNSWNLISLNSPVVLSGQDLWISYAVTHASSRYPAGNDSGPAVAGFGDMLSFNGISWQSAANNYNIQRNWNIAGHLSDAWLSVSPGSGTVNSGESMQVTVTFDSYGLPTGTYTSNLVFTSNATGSPHSIPVTLNVVTPEMPSLTTVAISGITNNSAVSGGNITSQGSAPVTARGVVWSTSPLPTIQSNMGLTTDGAGTGAFSSNIIGLMPETNYYLRAYATNSVGTAYGDQLSFATLAVHIVSLPTGWSSISSHLIPFDSNIQNLFEPVVEDLIILQNETGFYWPAENMNTLINWNRLNGYSIKMENATVFSFIGSKSTNKSLPLTTGWNLIPVLSESPADVVSLFAGKNLVIVKEVAGWKLYWPAMNINTLGTLKPGSAYYVLMGSSTVIIFP